MTLALDRPAHVYAATTAIEAWLHEQALDAWSELAPSNLQASFVGRVLPRLLPKVIAAQRLAASVGSVGAQRQIAQSVADQRATERGQPRPPTPAEVAAAGHQAQAQQVNAPIALQAPDGQPIPTVNPDAFAGVASDGRPLASLLTQPLVTTYTDLGRGAGAPAALAHGFGSMDQILSTQIHDASREASQAQIVAAHHIAGYLRMVEPGACGRCVILAGRIYKWSKGFERHPACRCTNTPQTDATEQPQDPAELFANMTEAEQTRAFTVAGARAIRDGADPARVVNARRGMSTAAAIDVHNADGTVTRRYNAAPREVYGMHLLTTSSGVAGERQRRGTIRLMPEAIYQIAGDDRQMAIRLLQQYHYITGEPVTTRAARAQAAAADRRANAEADRKAGEQAAQQAKQDAHDQAAAVIAEAISITKAAVDAEIRRASAESARLSAAQAKAEAKAARLAEAEAKKAARANVAALRLRSDDDLAADLNRAYEDDDDARVTTLENELNRRDEAEQRKRDLVEYNRKRAQDRRDAEKEAQSLRISRLIEEGTDPYEATEEVTGVTIESQHRTEAFNELRNNGYGRARNFNEASSLRWRDLVAEQMVDVENYTRGGDFRNTAGIEAGVNSDLLFFGNENLARKYASPELREYWDHHGRLTLDSLRHQLVTGLGGPRGGMDFLQ